MTVDNLKKAKELETQIEKAERNLHIWEQATSLNGAGVYVYPYSGWVEVSDQTFPILKALNTTHFTDIVASLKLELENL